MRAFLEKLTFLAKLRNDIRGNVLVIAGAGTVALVGGAGLGVDTVQWYLWKRQLQQAVDSSALAGGNAMAQNTNTWRTYANKELQRNANTTLSVVRMVNPPQAGAYTGSSGAVEVVATTSQALPFSGMFLDSSPTISARAVATTVADGEHCVITLAETGVGVSTIGSADVQLGCGVATNSKSLTALDLDGTSHLSGTPLSSVGGIQYSSGNIDAGTTVQAYGIAQEDPFAGQYSVPSTPAGCDYNNYTVNPHVTATLTPPSTGANAGFLRMCSGLTVRGELTLDPGVYIIDRGSFNINAMGRVTGEGVTIILTGTAPANIATVNIAGGATVQLRAPNSDDDPAFVAPQWYGMLFYQDPTADFPTSWITGDSDMNLEGIVYMPQGNMRFTGNSGQHAECLKLVTYRVEFAGEASLDNSCPTDIQNVDLAANIVRIVE